MDFFQWTGFTDEVSPQLDRQIAAAKSNGLSFIELRAVDGCNVSDLKPETARAIVEKLQDAGLSVSSLASPIGKTRLDEPFAPVAERMRRLVELSDILSAGRIRIFSFYPPSGVNPDDCSEEVIDRLGRLLEIAADGGVTLLHENEKGIYGDRHERCHILLKAFDGKLRGIIDPANAVEVGDDPLAAMDLLEPWIDYLHIKDCRRDDHRIVPAGHGDGGIEQLLRIFAVKPAPRFLSLEPHLTLFSGREKLEQLRQPSTPASGEFVYADGGEAFAAALDACRAIVARLEEEGVLKP